MYWILQVWHFEALIKWRLDPNSSIKNTSSASPYHKQLAFASEILANCLETGVTDIIATDFLLLELSSLCHPPV